MTQRPLPAQSRRSSHLVPLLFCVPFAAVGVFMLSWTVKDIATAYAMRSWVETPAELTTLDLKSKSGDKGTTYTIQAQYTYDVDGVTYQGERVAISEGSDNIGSYWLDLRRRLSDARLAQTVVCYVDPDDPQSAVLDRQLRWGLLAFTFMFAAVFGGFGFGLGTGIVIMRRRKRERERLQAENPDQVWRSDHRWRDGEIRACRQQGGWIVVPFAVLWNLIAWTVTALALPELWAKGERLPIATVLLFPVVGIGLAIAALYVVARTMKFGKIMVRAERLPLYLGQRHAVQVSGSRPLMATGPVQCALICGQLETTGSGKNRHTSESILWRHRWHEDAAQIAGGIAGWSLPLILPIPSDAVAMNDDERISWRLELRAPTSGIDFFASFPLPVLAADAQVAAQADSVPTVEPSVTRAALVEQVTRGMNEDDRDRLYRQAGLRRQAGPNHLRLISPPLRFQGSTIGMIGFGIVFGGFGGGLAAVFITQTPSFWFPMFFGAVFVTAGLCIAGSGLLALLRTYHIEVDRHGIHLRSGLLTPGTAREFPLAVIARIRTKESYSVNGVSRRRVVLEGVDGRLHRLTPVVGDKQDAESIAADIRRVVGLNG